MKTRLTAFVIFAISATSFITAQTKVNINNLYYNLSGNEAEVTYSNRYSSSHESAYKNETYTIPSDVEYNNLLFTVTAIGDYAFSYPNYGYGTTASSITLPNTIKRLGRYAFSRSDNLKTVVLPNSLGTIDENAFYYCKNLTTMVIPSSVSLMNESIFSRCDLLRILIYLPCKAPTNWTATTNTYVPSTEEYSSPSSTMNNAKVIEMLTFNDKMVTYGDMIDINDCKVNIADAGYELVSLTPKDKINTDVGEWTDILHAQFKNDDADVPILDVDIPFHHTIVPAKLTAKVVSVSREYGEQNPEFKVVYTGFVNNEDESVLEEPVKVTVNANENSPAGTYTISLSGGKAKNYEISYETGTLTVTKAPLTAKVKNVERTYGEPNPSFQIEYTGLKNGETVPVWTAQPTITTNATAQSNVGDYIITAEGGIARDYDLSNIAPGRLTITKAMLQVRAENAQRFYYEENPAFRCIYSGFVNSDNENVLTKQPTTTTLASLTSPAGSYPIKVIGGEAQNYDFTYTDGELTIMKRSLTVTSPNYERVYNEENPEIQLSYSGFVNNETEDVLTPKPVAYFNATKTSDVGVYNTIISGGDADNYDFIYRGGTLTITKADQTLTWEQDLSQIKVGSQIELNATASSGLEVTYLVPDNNFVSLYKAGTRTLLDCYGTGTIVIRATQEGNRNYYSSERLSKTVTVVSSTGISNVGTDDYDIHIIPNTIQISNLPTDVDARVYSLDGVLLYQGRDGIVNVQSGIYIVAVGDKKKKVFVK